MKWWLKPALYLSWAIFLLAAVVVASTCFAYIFLPPHLHLINIWELLIAGAALRLFMVVLGTLHHRLAKAYGEPPYAHLSHALFHLHWALRWLPGDLRLYTLWCQLLHRAGAYDQVEAVIQQMAYVHPHSDEIDTQRAYLALVNMDWRTACDRFDRAYRLRRGIAWNDVPERIPVDQPEIATPRTIETTWVKLEHDAAQLAFLRKGDYLPPAFAPLETAYQEILRDVASRSPATDPLIAKDRFIALNADQSASISLFYGRNVHVSPVPAFPRETLDPGWDASLVQQQYQARTPACVVIDHFLQPDTAEALLHFCQKSTIWHDDTRPGGYLGAYMDDGFNCELLYQIAFELKARMPEVFAGLTLKHMWAYSYAARKNGIGIHADNAAVNVNFWITPDEANLAPGTGGIKVYNVRAPESWAFESYNQDTAKVNAFLSQQQATAEVIPYAHNRAVLFDGRLFHETDAFRFADGYLKKRINITLLFDKV